MESLEIFKIVDGKKLRYGITTGTCCAAAAKSAVLSLFSNEKLKEIKTKLPNGMVLNLQLETCEISENQIICAVKKFSGDDPDVTNGLVFYAKAEPLEKEEIVIETGEGIGIVTKKGLLVDVGQPAINPVPKRTIIEEIKSVLPQGKGVKITLYVPGGQDVAKRTLNEKLGIIGGISILGTTGLVEPLSDSAFIKSLELELSSAAQESKKVVLVFGNYGISILPEFGLQNIPTVTIGNFVGEALEKIKELKRFEKVYFVGQIGKMIKVSAGIFNTHSKVADTRNEIAVAYASLLKIEYEKIVKIFNSNTLEEVLDIIGDKKQIYDFAKIVCERAKLRASQKAGMEIEIGIFSLKYGVLYKTWSR